MPKLIFLDSQPLSLLAVPVVTPTPQSVAGIRQWASACSANGHQFIVPEIVDYEVRRKLLRAGKTRSVAELDKLNHDFTFLPLTTAAMQNAAELWALVRRQGLPTAPDENIDVDVILAAQALTIGTSFDDIVVATVNPRHLSRFVTAKPWQEIVSE